MDASFYEKTKFKDVPKNEWYYSYVNWASENGIVNGVSDNEFAPDASVTREQIAVMLKNFSEYKGLETKAYDSSSFDSFYDSSKTSNWAVEALKWANYNKIINGTDLGLEPTKTATRAQVAKMISNYIAAIK